MRIAVVGIGGLGGYIGAKLCSLIGTQKKKYEIIFIARGEHARAVKQNGLKIIEDEGEFTVTPTAVCTAEEAEGTFDLIIVCVKSYAITEALLPLKKNIRQDTVVMSFANGVNNAQTISSILDAKVINGCAYILSHIKSAGIIHKKGSVFAVSFGDSIWSNESLYIDYMFKDAGLRSKYTEDIETAVWKKYLFISTFASLTSYYDMSIKEVHDQHYHECEELLEEIISVANAKGIDIKNEIAKALKTASSLPQGASTSMHLDFQQHRQTELDTLTKYIIDEAELLNIDVPVMQKLYDALREKK
ncbi:MAG: 2-dehydropantoate 2-reductase [Sulfurimonas sp.]|jgi:2-dehydropantoate 2-reductase|uniref:ketopantoate reductase family protein n=1 Tax=Sulfurimonas sp. TaxID=2022749 RepID=UPI0039E68522